MRLRNTIYILFCISASLFIMAILGELALRARGARVWDRGQDDIRVEPGGKFYRKDSLLGYTYLPGSFKVTLSDGTSFNTTHLKNALRITQPPDAYREDISSPGIWVFGCSVAYGWTLNDAETFTWLLQERLVGYRVVNFGACGYSTLQSLLQFREALKKEKPLAVLLLYGSYMDERNTFLRSRQKAVTLWNHLGPLVQPYARLGMDNRLRYGMAKVEYTEFPLMRRSVLANRIEEYYDSLEERFSRSHEASRQIIKEFASLCSGRGIKFAVVGFLSDPLSMDMLRYCADEGIEGVDISVEMHSQENVHSSSDRHPNAAANRKYAESLYAFLQDKLLR